MITGIVLAAGTSSRLGRPKQLLEVDGKPLAQFAIDVAAAAGLDEIVVVLGHEADRVLAALRFPPNARPVLNSAYAQGLSTSLAAGLDAAGPASEAAVVLLADQPGVSEGVIRSLVEAFSARRSPAVRARFRDGPGPALLARGLWDELSHLRGDTGARELLAAQDTRIEEVEIDADAPPDIDTWSDYERLAEPASPPSPAT